MNIKEYLYEQIDSLQGGDDDDFSLGQLQALGGVLEFLEHPQPLTLDELKTMEGKSNSLIWIRGRDNEGYLWDKWFGYLIIEAKYLICYCVGNEVEFEFILNDYGKTWAAYDYHPKEDIK